MNIGLVGGIFGKDASLRSKHVVTPETVLLEGFEKLGLRVCAMGHAQFAPSDEYDIVHVHHFGEAAMRMAASRSRSKFVFTGHNGLIVTGYERNWVRRAAFRYVVRKADSFVALSNAEAQFFERNGAAGKVCCIPNGIPPEIFRSYTGQTEKFQKMKRDSTFRILYVGQLIDWKGVNFLLESMKSIRIRHNVKLRLVYHNAELEQDYKLLARELGIDSIVEFVGILGPAELAREYYDADLLVLPSFADCLPSVVTESLLSGTPVVAGAVCGVPEQLDKFGIAIPPGDVEALTSAIERVIVNQLHYLKLATEMRSYAEEKYKPSRMIENHIELYKSLVSNSARRSTKRNSLVDPLARAAIRAYWPNAEKRGVPNPCS